MFDDKTSNIICQEFTARHSRNQNPGLDLAGEKAFRRLRMSATGRASLDHPDVVPGQAEARNSKFEDQREGSSKSLSAGGEANGVMIRSSSGPRQEGLAHRGKGISGNYAGIRGVKQDIDVYGKTHRDLELLYGGGSLSMAAYNAS
jgi:hypothetical protein